MTIQAHNQWLLKFRALADKMSFRVVDPHNDSDVTSLDISIQQNSAAPGGSAAEAPGWMVDVRYTNAPSVVLFTETYPTEDLARKVMEDLCSVASEGQGLLKQEKFEEASAKTKALLDKFKANSGQPPVEELGGPQ